MVIGRTDDNDIVVNHRSISRHHAKIVQENGRHAIVDLQSSNGVRVNGEEYGKVELRRGDVVDLGHVRMRFVEPGEDFLFGRDAHAVDISGGGGKGLIFALLAVLVIGGGIGVFALTRGSGNEEVSASGSQPEATQIDPGADPAKGAAADPNPTAPSPAAPASDDPAAKLVAEARQAIEAEHWKEAKQLAEKALVEDSENAEAQDVIDQATREIDNQVIYNQFKKAVAAKSYAKIATLFEQIDPTSVYKEQARDDHDAAHDEYKNEMVAKAESDAARGNCRKIAQLAGQAGKIWPDVGEAVTAVGDKCAATVAAAKSASHRSTSRATSSHSNKSHSNNSSSSNSTSSSSSASSGKSYNQLIDEARTAAKTGQWGKAIRQCEAALAEKHGDQEAAMVCALAACNIKNASKAKKYMGLLRSPSRKGMARQICLKNGVNIPIN